jgi:hypothetical protein
MLENCGIRKRPMIILGNECDNFAVCLFNSEPQGEPWKDKTNRWEIHLEYTGEKARPY